MCHIPHVLRIPGFWPLFALVVMSLVAGCGEGESPVVNEHDGPELAALVDSARQAILTGDEAGFHALYESDGAIRARDNWKQLKELKWSAGDYLITRLLDCPDLERLEPALHVMSLTLHVWFDFSKDSGDREDVYRTMWSFSSEGAAWRLNYMKIERTTLGYGRLMYPLHHMGYRDFLALGMEWHEGIDPTPLLDQTWKAACTGDPEAVKPYAVDGLLFYALDNNVDVPGIANDEFGSGEDNRATSMRALREFGNRMKEPVRILEVEPVDLIRFFNAYRVKSMPEDCTRLTVVADFGGEYVPSNKPTRFSIKWTGAYVKSRWLVQEMFVVFIYFD